MFTESLDKSEFEVTQVNPKYDEGPISGHFVVTFGIEKPVPYNLEFGSFITYMFERDPKLKEYMVKVGHSLNDKDIFMTFTDVIKEMYSIGMPVEDLVADYIAHVKSKVSNDAFEAMISLYKMLMNLDEPQRPDYE